MHMAFLSRVFKNLQWYGMTKTAFQMKSGFFFCLLPACMGCREAPGTRRLKDKKAIC